MARLDDTNRGTTSWSIKDKPLHWLFGIAFLVAVVVLPAAYVIHEDDAFAVAYRRYLAANPGQLSGLGAIHIQTAFIVSHTPLALIPAAASAVYATVTRTARDDARTAAGAKTDAQQPTMESQDRVAAALERIAAAAESNTKGAGVAPHIRSLSVLNVGRRPQ